jgi:hypothetical protein
MRTDLPIVLVVAGLIAGSAAMVAGQEFSSMDIVVPRPAAGGEAMQLQIRTGQLPTRARLAVTTENGVILGTVSSFPQGSRSASATIPVPPSALSDGHLRLRIQVQQPAEPPRAPRPGEVERVDLVIVPQSG